MVQSLMDSKNEENLWPAGNYMAGTAISYPAYNFMNNNYVSPQSSPESINHYHDNKEAVMSLEDIQNRHDKLLSLQPAGTYNCGFGKKGPSGSHIDQLGELQELASRMMNN